jgi:hypothetical protein
MTTWQSKLFAIFLGLAMLSILASPASAKHRHRHRRGHRGSHHAAQSR